MTERQITAASERVVNTVEQCLREMELAAVVLRLVPDVTAARLEALLATGLAAERLEQSAPGFNFTATKRAGSSLYQAASFTDNGPRYGEGGSLASAVDAALKGLERE